MPWEQLRDSPVPLRVVATAVDDLSAHVLKPGSVAEWKLALRATSAIPLLAGQPVELHGRRWIDGSVTEPLPVLRALRDGATHVLALVNRTVPELRRVNPAGRPARWARTLDRLAPGLGSMAQESQRLRPEMAALDNAAHPSRSGTHLFTITPEQDAGVRGLTIDADRVRLAAAIGYGSVQSALERAGAPTVPGS
jgi:predicted patatin/cPLA2 family phospholipase